MACTDAQAAQVLDALQRLGGATTRTAVWDNLIGGYLDRRTVGACLAKLEKHGLAFANDGNGTLSRWGGIRRGQWWSTRESLERNYRYGAAELGPVRPLTAHAYTG